MCGGVQHPIRAVPGWQPSDPGLSLQTVCPQTHAAAQTARHEAHHGEMVVLLYVYCDFKYSCSRWFIHGCMGDKLHLRQVVNLFNHECLLFFNLCIKL